MVVVEVIKDPQTAVVVVVVDVIVTQAAVTLEAGVRVGNKIAVQMRSISQVCLRDGGSLHAFLASLAAFLSLSLTKLIF
jgi:hypothetical protein